MTRPENPAIWDPLGGPADGTLRSMHARNGAGMGTHEGGPISSVLAAQGDPLKQSVCRWRGRAAMAATGVRGVGARRLFVYHSDHLKGGPSFVFRFPCSEHAKAYTPERSVPFLPLVLESGRPNVD